jgi:hypothetical protein
MQCSFGYRGEKYETGHRDQNGYPHPVSNRRFGTTYFRGSSGPQPNFCLSERVDHAKGKNGKYKPAEQFVHRGLSSTILPNYLFYFKLTHYQISSVGSESLPESPHGSAVGVPGS